MKELRHAITKNLYSYLGLGCKVSSVYQLASNSFSKAGKTSYFLLGCLHVSPGSSRSLILREHLFVTPRIYNTLFADITKVICIHDIYEDELQFCI